MLSESDLNADQRTGGNFLAARDAAILWGDVGTGKTIAALTALLKLLDSFDAHSILVVGPRLVSERVWSAEVAQWAHTRNLKVVRIVGTAKQRLKAIETPADIHTISRDNVQWLEECFIRVSGVNAKGDPVREQYRKWRWDTVVLDESQSFMSQKSKRFKSMRRLRRLFKRVYLLSGSLMPNGYKCLWSQMYLVDRGERLGLTEDAYHKRWWSKDVRDGVVTWELKGEWAAEEIDRRISDVCFVMRDKKQVKPLNLVWVKLDKKEQQLYSRMAREKILELGGQQINAVNAGVLWGKLLQLANGAVYDAEKNWHVLHTKKLEALIELLECLPRKVLIGYGFVHDIERIQVALKAAKIDGVGIIRTNASLDAWQAGKIWKGIIHPASAGHGLNELKDAEAVVWFGLTPNFEYFQQLNGRVIGGHRLQGRDIGIHIIGAENTVDEDAVGLIDFKGEQQLRGQIRVAQRWVQEVV